MTDSNEAKQPYALTLYYFNIPGKGSCIRLLCKYCGLNLKDYRFSSRDEFIKMKESGKLTFGQVPAIEITKSNGESNMLFQSAAIMRFLGKISKKGLYPTDPVAASVVDMIMDQEADAFQGLRVAKYKDRFGFKASTVLTEDVAKGVIATINAEIIPRHLGYIEALLKKGATGWLAGTKSVSVADFFWYPTFKALNDGWSGNPAILKGFPEIQKFMARFEKETGLIGE